MDRDIEQEKKRLEEALLSEETEEMTPAEEALLEEILQEQTPELEGTEDEILDGILQEPALEEEILEEELQQTDEEILEEILQEQTPDTTQVFSGQLNEEKRAPIWFPILVLMIMAVVTGYVVATLVKVLL